MNGPCTRGIFGYFTRRCSTTRKLVSFVAVLTFALPLPAFPQQIVPDGKTATSLSIRDNVTDVTTFTIRGANAYNSFSKFDVYQGNVVNLHVPGSAVNLLNLVHGQASSINGILNAYKDGRIGGNVFFANPYGFLVGSSGMVNVGTLTVMTPTKAFMDNFFDSPGNPSLTATSMLLNRTAPIDPNGLISIRGRVNALGDIKLLAGSVQNSGVIASGAAFSGDNVDFSDLVNANGLESGARISVHNGTIEIIAAKDVVNAGEIVTDGSPNRNAGEIHIRSGNDVILNDGSLLSAKGRGENSSGGTITVFADRNAEMKGAARIDVRGGDISGDGGFIELSAKEKVILEGGLFKASAQAGKAGKVLIDPDEIIIGSGERTDDGETTKFVNFSEGEDVQLTADRSITVNSNVILSTRKIDGSLPDTAENHLTADSKGDSGDIRLTAPQITINSGAMLLAHAINQKDANGQNITNYTAGDITLIATDQANVFTTAANITLNGATLKGKDVSLQATAQNSQLFDDDGTPSNVALNFFEGISFLAGVAESRANAEVIIKGSSSIEASTLALNAFAQTNATVNTLSSGLGVAVGISNPTAKVIVGDGTNPVVINTTGDVTVKSRAVSYLDVNAYTVGLGSGAGSPADVTFAFGQSTIESTAQIARGVDAGKTGGTGKIGGGLEVKAEVLKNQNVSALSGAYENGSMGAAAAVSLSTSHANAFVDGAVNAGKGITIVADSQTPKNDTSASAGAGSGLLAKSILGGAGWVKEKLEEKFSKKKPDPRSGSTASFKLSGALAYAEHAHNATARIGESAEVASRLSTLSGPVTDAILIRSYVKDVPEIAAISMVNSDKVAENGGNTAENAISAAVVIGDFTNNADAHIGRNAVVNAKNPITVTSRTEIPWEIQWTDLNSDNMFNFIKDKFNTNLGLQNGFFTSWAQSMAQGTKTAVAGSVNILGMNNTSKAYIDEGARINQDLNYQSGLQDVKVTAVNEMETLNLSGIFGLANVVDLLSVITGTNKFASVTPGTAGVGGSYLQVGYNNTVTAEIRKDAQVHAESLLLEANSTTRNISIGEAGGKAGSYAINGTFSLLKTNDTTIAKIDDGATVTTNAKVIPGDTESTNVLVKAKDNAQIYNISGGISKGQNVGVGVSVSINEITRDTEALIGNRENETDEAAGSLSSNGKVKVAASNDGLISSWSLAAAVATQGLHKYDWPEDGVNSQSPMGREKLAAFLDFRMKNPKPQYGLGISGDVSVNLISDTAKAYINDADIANAGDLALNATNDSEIAAVAGSVTITKADGTSGGLAGSVTWNEVTNTTKSYVDHSTLGVTGDVGLTADSTGTIKTIAASGSGAVSRVSDSGIGVAGSLAYSYIDNETSAYINNSDVSNATKIADDISLSALDDSTIWSIAGAGSYGGKAGIGASIAVNRMDNSTEAYAKDSDIASTGDILISADEKSEIKTVSAAIGAAKDGMAVAASASGNDLSNTTKAYISGKKADGITADGNISLAANDDADILSIAGNISIAKGSKGVGGAGFGVSASVTVTDNTVEAYIGSGSIVTAKGLGDEMAVYTGKKDDNGNRLTETMKGVSVTATSYEDILSVAAGGAGAEKLAIEGSAAVHVLKETTKAHIDGGATVTAGEAGKGTEQSVNVRASDTTDILGIAGAAMGSMQGGVGAGADVGVITKNTQAYIGNNANVQATKDIRIQSLSQEDINSIAGTIAVGKDWAFGGAASVYVIGNETKAYIEGGDASTTTVHADGNILIAADNGTEIDSIAGSVVFGMSAGIGASVTTAVITKTTEAFVGKNANVEADGKRDEIDVATGKFVVQSVDNTGDDYSVDASDTENLNLNADVDTTATATAETKKVKGLAVTAVSKDDVSSIAASGGGSGTVAVNLAGSVNVVANNTSAYIAEGAKINENNASAGDSQSVLVAAGTDFRHLGIGAAVSIGGQVGFGPSAEITVVNNNTSAYIGKSAQVKAKQDVEVLAESTQDILSITGAGALGIGAVGLAGSVSVISIDNETLAYVGDKTTGNAEGTTVNAGGNIVISAKDKTETDIVSGSLAGGLVGIGGAVGVTLIEKDTKAFVGNKAVVNAKGNSDNAVSVYSGLDYLGNFTKKDIKGLSVQAESSEDFSTITGAFAGGFAGVAGAVVVNTIESDTVAYVGDAAQVNQDQVGVGSAQDVNVAAVNDVTDFAVSGSVAGGAVGLSGGLGFHTIQNNTSAYLGNGAKVNAAQDVELDALSKKKTETYAVSAAGGLVGLAGGVTVLTIGNTPDDADAKALSAKGGNGGYSNPSSYAERQAKFDFLGEATSDSYGMDDAKAQAAEKTSKVTVAPTSVPSGTAAFIGKSATVNAGRDININAQERLDVDMLSGGAASGIASLGGSIGIANIRSQVKAYIDEDDPVLSSSINAKGNINILAVLKENTLNQAFAGGISAFLSASGAVTYVDNDYLVDAHIGKKVTIDKAGSIAVTAETTTDDKAESLEGGLAGLGLAAGISYAEVDSDGTTAAYLDDNVKIGTAAGKTVDNLTVKAGSSNKGDTNSKHLAGGIIAGGYNESDSSVNPTVTAAIGADAIIKLKHDLTVAARADVNSTAYTWGGAFGGVAVGAGVVEASAKPVVSAYIKGGDLSDIYAEGAIRIKAYGNYDSYGNEQTKIIKAENDATEGSLFFSHTSPSSTATSDWTVDAYIGTDANIEADGDLEVLAKSYSGEVKSDVDGHAYTLGPAMGNNVSTSTVKNTVNAHIDQDASVSAGSVNVSAQGKSNGYATTFGGAGGIYAGASASANVNVTNSIDAYLMGNKDKAVKISADRDIEVSALSDIVFNARGTSMGFGLLVGNNGARINNSISSTAKAHIGENADVEAGEDISVDALNRISKANLGVTNLAAGSGGFWGGPAGDSVTTINNTAQAYLAGNRSAEAKGRIYAGNDITLSAANDVFAYDRARLMAGGAIAVADVHSTITDTNTATAYIGENAEVEAGNDVNVHSKTRADVEAVTYTEGFGLGASADGKAEVTVMADNDSNIAVDATVKAGNDINVFAGKGPDGMQNNLRARSEARSFSAGGIPFSSVEGYATLNNYNDILVAAGAGLRSGRDINLGALKGSASVEGFARAKLRTYLLFGIPITWYNDGSRSSVSRSSDSVTVNGSAESGLNSHKILHIDALGQVSSDSNIGYLFQKDIDGAAELQARINDLNTRIQNETDNNVKILLSQDKARYEARRDEILAKRTDPNNPDPDYGWFNRFSIEDTRVGSGDINISGTLKGNGTLKVPGNDFMIEILNDSLTHLEVNDLEIPEDLSGNILVNNRAITSHSTLTIDPGKNLGKRIIVENRYDPDAPGADENAASDMVLKGDITNNAGTIDITNLSGGIESLGDVVGDEVTIYARREFAQNYMPGVWNSSPPDPLIAGGNINISGEILNINGTIQSGTPYRTITIPDFDPATDLTTVGNVQNVIPTTGDSNIRAVWDAENQCIQLYSVKITGGNITLAGEIVSTGGGKLKVIDGYGEIDIRNNSSKDMVINKLDVGKRINSMIKITDTGKLDSAGNPLVTEIRRDNGKVNVVEYRVRWDDEDGKVKIVEGSGITRPPVDGRTSAYQPRAGARFYKIGNDKVVLSNNKYKGGFWDWFFAKYGEKGDHSIGVEFIGSDQPRIDVANTSASNVFINNNILNRDGNVSIRNDHGSIYSLNESAQIRGRNISLSAPEADVGDINQAIKIDTRGGILNAEANGLVHIEEVDGDLTVGSVSTAGNVKITADGSILDLPGNNASIIGKDITLLSRYGGIGKAENDLTMDSQDGIVTAEAEEGIYLTETKGGMRVNKVTSDHGDVVLIADGPVEDYNFPAGYDDDTLSQLDAAKNDLRLESTEKVQEAINAHKKQKKEEYQAAHRISDNGTPYEPNDDTYDSTYNPNWEYTLTASEEKAFAESVWKDEYLVNAKNIVTLPGAGASAEEPNVSGRNVTIITNGGVGIYGGEEVITAEEISNGKVTPEQRLMIARAEKENLTLENGNLIVQLKNDLDIRSSGAFVIRSKDDVYLGSETDVNIDRIESTNGDIRLKVAGSIANGREDGGVNLVGDNLILETPAGSVGSSAKPLVTDLRQDGVLTASVRDDLFLEERSGDLTADSVVSQNGSIGLTISDGSATIGHISAPGTVSVLANGPVLNIQLIDPDVLDLRNPFPGAVISVDQAEVAQSVTAWSDTIRLGDINHTGQGTLHFDVRGGSKLMADRVEIGADSSSAIDFDPLYADIATVNARVDRLSLHDTLIGSRGDIRNNLYHVIVDNRNMAVQPSHLQLYAPGPFSLELSAEQRFRTSAFVINYDPAFIVNEVSTENSVVGMTQKMLWTGKREDRLYYDPMEPAPRPWQREVTPSGREFINVQPGSVGIGADDAQLKMENVDVIYE